MATVNIYLDSRRLKRDGKAPLKLAINHAEGNHLIPLDLFVRPDDWDKKSRIVTGTTPAARKINFMLMQTLIKAEEELSQLVHRATLAETIEAVRNAIFGDGEKKQSKRSPHTIVSVGDRFMKLHKEKSTRKLYQTTLNHIRAFRQEARFEEVGRGWLEEFDEHLSCTVRSINGRAVYMRSLRAIFNFAIDEGITQNYPFRKFKVKTIKTPKRSLTAEQIRQIFTMEVDPWQRPYRDFFMLSFLLIGINAKDLLFLGPQKSERIEFNRAKTKRLYSIYVEPEARKIIEQYSGKDHLLSFMDKRKDNVQFLKQCNHALKLLGTRSREGRKPEGSPLFPEISTYWARHSWATIAASLDIPKETIAAALGHGGNTVTDIYIDFDQRKVDAANRRVIDFVLYGITDSEQQVVAPVDGFSTSETYNNIYYVY